MNQPETRPPLFYDADLPASMRLRPVREVAEATGGNGELMLEQLVQMALQAHAADEGSMEDVIDAEINALLEVHPELRVHIRERFKDVPSTHSSVMEETRDMLLATSALHGTTHSSLVTQGILRATRTSSEPES